MWVVEVQRCLGVVVGRREKLGRENEGLDFVGILLLPTWHERLGRALACEANLSFRVLEGLVVCDHYLLT